MSEVVFWDILVFMEATRTYYKLRGNKEDNSYWKKKYDKQRVIQSNNPHTKAKYQEGTGLLEVEVEMTKHILKLTLILLQTL